MEEKVVEVKFKVSVDLYEWFVGYFVVKCVLIELNYYVFYFEFFEKVGDKNLYVAIL